MTFTAAQEDALGRILEGETLFLTGQSGSGRAAVLDEAARRLDGVVRLSVTALCATVAGTESLRSFLGLKRSVAAPQAAAPSDAQLRKLRSARIIMIEECNRLRIDQFQELRDMLVGSACGTSPFGGRQLVLSGDFTQLTSVTSREEDRQIAALYGEGRSLGPHNRHWSQIALAHIGAVDDHPEPLADWLAGWRQGVVGAIPARTAEFAGPMTVLTPSGAEADALNERAMGALPDGVYRIPALEEGDGMDMAVPCPQTLALRRGSRVLICAPHPDGLYRPGDTGELVAFRRCPQGEPIALVRRDDGSEVEVIRHAWKGLRHSAERVGAMRIEERGRFIQTPLVPGWAISIWRMGEMRLGNVHADPGVFAQGRAGFVVSRVAGDGLLSVSRMPDPATIPGPAIADNDLEVMCRPQPARAELAPAAP